MAIVESVAGFGLSTRSSTNARTVILRPKNFSTPKHNNSSSSLVVCNLQRKSVGALRCNASEVETSITDTSSSSSSTNANVKDGNNWIPVVPLIALPKGERRLIRQDGETIMLLWYKNDIFAIENRSPAEGAYSEGLLNAKLTQDGCIVCPTTESTYSLKTGDIVDWYPKNPILRFLTPPLRKLFIYPTKTDSEYIYIDMLRDLVDEDSAEIVFSGQTQAGTTATNVNVDELRMEVDEEDVGVGFTRKSEIINGKAALAGLYFLINFELLTGTGFLQGTGVLDFLYKVSKGVIQRSA